MFMRPEIYRGRYYEVENDSGETSWIPADVVRVRGEVLDALAEVVDGEPVRFSVHTGVLGRLTAPGYLDATEWEPFDSEAEAEESLAEELAGDDEDDDDDDGFDNGSE